jgi:hypothetical protein
VLADYASKPEYGGNQSDNENLSGSQPPLTANFVPSLFELFAVCGKVRPIYAHCTYRIPFFLALALTLRSSAIQGQRAQR